MAAPALTGSVSATTNGGVDLTFGALSGANVGDFGVLSVLSYGGTEDWAVPSGWTAVPGAGDLSFGSGGAGGSVAVFYKESLASGDIDGITVTNAASHWLAGTLSAYSPCGLVDQSIASVECGTSDNGASAAVDVPAESLVAFALHMMTSSSDVTPPGGTTERHDVANPISGTIRSCLYDVAPAETAGYTRTFTFAQAAGGVSRTGRIVSLVLGSVSAPPQVDTNAAAGVGPHTATLNGDVDATNGADTTWHFEIGLDASYGTSVGTGIVVEGGAPEAQSVAVRDLEFATEYHFRIVGVNDAGTTNGDDMTFTTDDRPTQRYGKLAGGMLE